jgi:hypothetical protein
VVAITSNARGVLLKPATALGRLHSLPILCFTSNQLRRKGARREKPAYPPTPVSFAMNNFAPLEIVQQQGFGTVGYLRA